MGVGMPSSTWEEFSMDESSRRFELWKRDCGSDRSRAEYLMGSALFHRDIAELLREYEGTKSPALEARIRSTLASCVVLENAAKDGRDDVVCPKDIPAERFDDFLRDSGRETSLIEDIGRRMADLTRSACALLRRTAGIAREEKEPGADALRGPASSEADIVLSGAGPGLDDEWGGGYLRLDVYTELCIALLADIVERGDTLQAPAEKELTLAAVQRAFSGCSIYMPERLEALHALFAKLEDRVEKVQSFKERIEAIMEIQKRETAEKERGDRETSRMEEEHVAAVVAAFS